MIFYLPVKQHLFHPDIGDYISYGIAAVRLFHGWGRISFVADVDTSARKVFSLALSCTWWQLDPVHLMDVVEDFLCS